MHWMEWLAAVGGGAFILACVVVGCRLLALALRTREVPDLSMAFGLLLMGGVSYPITVAARMAVGLSDEARVGLMLLSQLLMLTGCAAVGVFNWRVFRPAARWPLVLIVSLALANVAFFFAQSVSEGMFAFVTENRGAFRFVIIVHGIPYLWAFLECGSYSLKHRRRAKLGLADPVVGYRMALWTLCTGCATVINQSMISLELLGINSSTAPIAGVIVGPFGLTAAISLWLAFEAPAALLQRWTRGAESGSGSATP